MNDVGQQRYQSQIQYELFIEELKLLVNEAEQVRLGLFHTLHSAHTRLAHSLSKSPGKPSSSYWRQYSDYWQAFVLFKERIVQTFAEFHYEYVVPEPFGSMPAADTREDWLDQIEEVIQAYRLRRDQRRDFLAVIELVDSVKRLKALKIPFPTGEGGKPYYKAIERLKTEVKEIEKSICDVLTRFDVIEIKLRSGDYPPPEITRVTGRRENSQGDNVVIDEIVLNGYWWKEKLLRKADVIIVAKKENC